MRPTLLVLAAGMGSRYGGVKQIDAVGPGGECLLDYAAYDARRSGFGDAVFIIRRDIEADFRARLFDRVARNFDARYVFQERGSLLTDAQRLSSEGRTKPWGTVHAVLCAEDAVRAPFAVINSDDYYGSKALGTLAAHLAAMGDGSTDHAMVGYRLGRTMSRSGSVSRGVCKVADGRLVSIVENLKIRYEGDGIVSEMDGRQVAMTGDEWVSMNLFGFGRSAFAEFHAYWERFIAENAASPKAEALLPAAAGEIVSGGRGTIRFFSSDESWFGMTYPADRETVRAEIAKKIRDGYYPERLWEK